MYNFSWNRGENGNTQMFNSRVYKYTTKYPMKHSEILSISANKCSTQLAKQHGGISHNSEWEKASHSGVCINPLYSSKAHNLLEQIPLYSLIFRPHIDAGRLQQLLPLNPLLVVSSRSKKMSISLVILTKYPKLGLIGPDW